jgi:uncharacterized protein involved in exopolysaccharide biosynthesis
LQRSKAPTVEAAAPDTVESYFETKNNLKTKYDELQKVYDELNTQYYDLEFKNKDDERAKVKAELDANIAESDYLLAQLQNLKFPAATDPVQLDFAREWC